MPFVNWWGIPLNDAGTRSRSRAYAQGRISRSRSPDIWTVFTIIAAYVIWAGEASKLNLSADFADLAQKSA
jgi:hypothetical protein